MFSSYAIAAKRLECSCFTIGGKKKKRERIREEEKKKRFAVGGPLAIFSFLSNFQRLLIKTQKKSKQAENSRSSIMKIHSYE